MMDRRTVILIILVLFLPVFAGAAVLLTSMIGLSLEIGMQAGLWVMSIAPLLLALASEISGRSVISRTAVNLFQPATKGITRRDNPILFYLIQSLCIGVGVYLMILVLKLSPSDLSF